MISVGDAINEPRYPSLKAIMGAKKKPLETKSAADAGIEADRVGYDNARAHCTDFAAPPAKAAGPDHRGRGHERDGREDRRLAGREEAAGMSGILVYALHYEGAFNKNSLGAVSEGARLASELGTECHAIVVGDEAVCRRPARAQLGTYGATKVFRVEGPEGLAQPVVDAMAAGRSPTAATSYALFGGGLLGFEIGAGLAARLDAGVCMEVTDVRVEDGKLVAERPILQDSQISDVHYRSGVGVIIGRLNAFEVKRDAAARPTVEDVDGRVRAALAARPTMVQRGEQRGADVNIEDADILVAGGRGLGKAEGFDAARGARRRARRRRRGDPRGGRRRLVPLRGPDRPDGQDRRAEALPGRGHLRRDPAQGRHAGLGEHRGDQQGLERPDLRVLRPRHRRRPEQDRARSSPRP